MTGAPALPPRWVTARLEELFRSITDGDHQPPPQAPTGVPFVVIGDVRNGSVDLSDARFVNSAYYSSLPDRKKPARGDLLYTVTGSFGIPVVVSKDAPFCVQRHIAILKPEASANVRYVAHALATNAALRQAAAVATGTAQKTVGLARLRTITIPLAPTNEQQRIVEALDSYLTRIDAAVASLEGAQRKLKAYRTSVLKTAVEGRLVSTEAELARKEGRSYEPADVLLDRILKARRCRWEEAELAKMTAAGKAPRDDQWKAKYDEPAEPDASQLPRLPHGWCWATLDELSILVRNGHPAPPRESAGVRTLRISAVRPLGVDFDHVRYLPGRPEDFADDLIELDDILFTRYNGTPAFVGVGGRIRFLDRPTVHPDKLIKVRLVNPSASAFLEVAVNAGCSRRHMESRTRTTAGQAGISGADLKQMPVPFPPLEEQERIASTVDVLLSVEAAMRRDIDLALRRCAVLRQAVLKAAFTGMLVDQDADDEPADVLLARICAERAPTVPARPKQKRARRTKVTS